MESYEYITGKAVICHSKKNFIVQLYFLLSLCQDRTLLEKAGIPNTTDRNEHSIIDTFLGSDMEEDVEPILICLFICSIRLYSGNHVLLHLDFEDLDIYSLLNDENYKVKEIQNKREWWHLWHLC